MVILPTAEQVYPHKLRRLYWPFLALAEVCREVVGTVAGSFEVEEKRYTIPRFVFHGPATNAPPIRLGLFALVHGDEPAGALGLERLLGSLVNDPAPAAGYEITLYPLCNPTGYEDGTRQNRAGHDLNREFWRDSDLPEIKIIEDELRERQFDGIIALHADDKSNGLRGYTQDRVLNENFLAPALRGAAYVKDCHHGVLSPPPEQSPRPFGIIFETPAAAPMTQQVEAIACAVSSIVAEYRGFIAQRDNL
jgi:hypothetical protein